MRGKKMLKKNYEHNDNHITTHSFLRMIYVFRRDNFIRTV